MQTKLAIARMRKISSAHINFSYFSFIFFMSLLYLLTYITNTLSVLGLFSTLLLAIIVLNREYSFLVFVFTLPFYGISGIEGIGIFIVYLLAVFTAKQYLLNKLRFKTDRILLPLFFLFLAHLFSYFITPDYADHFYKTVSFFFLLILVRLLLFRVNIHKILYTTLFALLLSSFIGLYSDRFQDAWDLTTLTSRFIGSVEDANYYARFILFGLSFSLILYVEQQNNLSRIIIIIITLILFYFLIQAASKMGVIVFIIMFIYFLYYSSKKRRVLFFQGVLLFVILIFVVNYFIDTSFIVNRFITTDSNLSSFSTGRLSLQLGALIKWINSDPVSLLFGMGIGTSKELTKGLSVEANVLHSVYLQTLVETGLFGFIALITFLWNMFMVARRSLTSFLPFIVFVITSLALSGLFYWDLFLYYLIFDKLNFDYEK